MLRFLRGYVRFEGEGGFPENLLSDAARMGITITDSYRVGETLYAACPASHYKKLRPLARRACMRLRIRSKHGLYFRLFPYRRRIGLPVGAVLAAVLLYVLSGRIWVVQVESAVPIDTAAVLRAVEAQGVYPGCRIDRVDMQELRLKALSDLSDVVYLSVNPSGCVARIAVSEREPAPSISDFHADFSNMIAITDGKILSMEVYSGQAAVQKGDGVSAGTLLISGTTESAAGNLYLRRAAGRVMAETTRTVSVTVPFSETKHSFSADTVCCPSFRFLNWDIPLYGALPSDGEYQVSVFYRLPSYRGMRLPIGIVDRRYVGVREQTVTYTKPQAEALAVQRLQEKQQALADNGIAVKAERSRHSSVTPDSYTLTVSFLCEENIAKEVPLKFADNSPENS